MHITFSWIKIILLLLSTCIWNPLFLWLNFTVRNRLTIFRIRYRCLTEFYIVKLFLRIFLIVCVNIMISLALPIWIGLIERLSRLLSLNRLFTRFQWLFIRLSSCLRILLIRRYICKPIILHLKIITSISLVLLFFFILLVTFIFLSVLFCRSTYFWLTLFFC